jgi:hypothetical protein
MEKRGSESPHRSRACRRHWTRTLHGQRTIEDLFTRSFWRVAELTPDANSAATHEFRALKYHISIA